jgi:CheY-like chemotaxis protein
LGFFPTVAENGPMALDTLSREANFDLLITDVVMPKGMSGLDLARIIQKDCPKLPLIFISGYADDTEALGDVMATGGILLSKPFSRAHLAEAVRTALAEEAAYEGSDAT